MPTLVYLSMRNKPIFTEEWQMIAFIIVAIVCIIALALVLRKAWKE